MIEYKIQESRDFDSYGRCCRNRSDCNGKGTADPYQDKVLRASQGSVFHIPVISESLQSYINTFNGPVYGTALDNAVSFKEIEAQETFALILVMKVKV